MLKVSSITLIDKKGQELFINGKDIESFPLVGGEEANMVNTKVYNQHGNTFVQSFMETHSGEILFIIPYFSKTNKEVFETRKSITDICNPLNGTVTMKIVLNTGGIFNRDITFPTAPVFPTGFENRNEKWQKVQLLYEANDPFWYEEEDIVETFQNVEPLIFFPFEMGSDYHTMKSDYTNKVVDSVIENPNLFKYRSGTTLSPPSAFTSNAAQASIDAIKAKDLLYAQLATTGTGVILQYLFSFDLVSNLERKFGVSVWKGATLLADKIALAKTYITLITYKISGYGIIPTGNKITYSRWNTDINDWYAVSTYSYTHSSFIEKNIASDSIASNIDSNGFCHLTAYTDAANGTFSTMVRIDNAFLDIQISLDESFEDPIYFGNVLPSKVANNKGQAEAPVIIKIVGSCVNPLIENKTTGEFIKFKDLTLGAKDELLIDTTFGKKKVEVNGQNVFNKLDYSSTFFSLISGDNEIDFSDETQSNLATIHFIYKNLYITI